MTMVDAPDTPAATTAPPSPEDVRQADSRVLRRARNAGLLTFGVVGVAGVLANALFGGDAAAAVVWVCAAAVVAALAWAGWLVLVLILDLVAGQLPTTRRLVWTGTAFVLAFVSPILPTAALRAAAGG